MTNNAKKPGTVGSTSFRYDEVNAMCQLMDVLLRGGDVRIIMRQKSIQSVYGKFKRMKIRLDDARNGATS